MVLKILPDDACCSLPATEKDTRLLGMEDGGDNVKSVPSHRIGKKLEQGGCS